MKICCAILFILLSGLDSRGQYFGGGIVGTPGGPGVEALSENGKYLVEITRNGNDSGFMIAVFKKKGEKKTLEWSRKVEPNSPLLMGRGLVFPESIFLSNNGKSVVFHESSSTSALGLVSPSLLAKIPFLELQRLLIPKQGGRGVAPDLSDAGFNFESFDFLKEDKEPALYCLWQPALKEWIVADLETFTAVKAPADLKKELNDFARPIALKRIAEHQPNPLKRMLGPLRKKAEEMISGIVHGAGGPDFYSVQSAYLFIAEQKKPQDKKLIEGLLTTRFDPMGYSASGTRYEVESNERALGDQLLAVWEGKASKSQFGPYQPSAFGSRKYVYLGSVEGTLQLPIPVPDKCGDIFVYLIPASVPKKEWETSRDVVTLRFGFEGETKLEPLEEVEFAFGTVTPGEYRLKAVWDRRQPYADSDVNVTRGDAGDYESLETTPFKIEAGRSATNLVLFCTNPIGQADNYYAADQAWKKNCLEIFAARAADTNLNPSGERTIFTAPVENWVLQTNRNQGEFSITKVSVFRTDREDVAGSLLVTLRGSRGDEALMLNAELRDDHACGFRGENLSEGNKFTVRFPNYPRNENTFFFNIGKESDDGEVIIPYSSFTLTNLFKQTPDHFKVEPFPAKRELDLVTVSLSKLEGGYPQFEFFKNGKPNKSWHEGYVQLVDRFGNKGSALSEFCAKETKFKVRATFSRDSTADYSAEEKWEVNLSEIPAPGKFVELNQTKIVNGMRVELVAITGTGEFTYKDGTVTAATATIETNKPANHFRPLNIPEEEAHFPKPKVYLKGEQHLGGPVFGRPFGREEVIVSKVPHVAVRIPSEDNALEFAFQEQDTSSPGAAYSTHQDGLRFFPIDLAKFAATKKLTFTVQKPREAEFIVEVPARISQKQE